MESDETNMPPFIGLASPRPIGLGDPQALAERIAALEAQLEVHREASLALRQSIVELEAEVERLRPVWHAAKSLVAAPFSFTALDSGMNNLRAAIDADMAAREKP